VAPEPLVTVSWFGTPELAAEDLRRLQDAGLDAYLGGEFHRYHEPVELRVPESQVPKAFEVLGVDPPEPEVPSSPLSPTALVCPDCGSADSYRLPPYAFRALIASMIVLVLGLVLDYGAFGGILCILGWMAAIWLSRRSGNHRCRKCGREWKLE
jgi:hypothetical protein